VGNFPARPGSLVDFPSHSIGIRDVNEPNHSEFGGRIEGVYKGVGFSLNAMYFYSQFPSLRGGIPTDDPFTPAVESVPHPYDIAFRRRIPASAHARRFGGLVLGTRPHLVPHRDLLHHG
jgi:hypothetical protein